jgi:hypothetical protein
VNEEIRTRVVEEFDNSLMAMEIKTGIHTAIIKASIKCSAVHVGELKIALNTFGSNGTNTFKLTVGKAIKMIRI